MVDIKEIDLEFWRRIQELKKFWEDHYDSHPNAKNLYQHKVNMLNGLDLGYEVFRVLLKENNVYDGH